MPHLFCLLTCLYWKYNDSCILRTIRQALVYISRVPLSQGTLAKSSLTSLCHICINKKSQLYHLSSYCKNKLIGVGLLLNSSILLKEPLFSLPSPVNTVTYKQKKPTLPLILLLRELIDRRWLTSQQFHFTQGTPA